MGWPISPLVWEPSNPLRVPCPLLGTASLGSKVVFFGDKAHRRTQTGEDIRRGRARIESELRLFRDTQRTKGKTTLTTDKHHRGWETADPILV